MKVFIPWLHWLSKLDIFSCINNIWNFSLVIISCWFLKRTIEILITVTILSALLFVFEWKSWNSISVCVYVYASMCECIFYKILKAVANVWYFPSKSEMAFCTRSRRSTLPVGQVRYLTLMKCILHISLSLVVSVTGFCLWSTEPSLDMRRTTRVWLPAFIGMYDVLCDLFQK